MNPDNPIQQLSIDQLSDIYTGKITNWKDLGGDDVPILALSRERNSGTHVFVLEDVVLRGRVCVAVGIDPPGRSTEVVERVVVDAIPFDDRRATAERAGDAIGAAVGEDVFAYDLTCAGHLHHADIGVVD